MIPICISLFASRRNDILPEAYARAVSSEICIAANDLEKLPVRSFIFFALRLQATDYLSSLDEAFEIAIPMETDTPIYCLVFCEHQASSHQTGYNSPTEPVANHQAASRKSREKRFDNRTNK